MNYTIERALDGTIKFSYAQGYYAVLIPLKNGKTTLCMSTQVGCPVKCKFCHSGILAFKKNLTLSELQEQFENALEYLKFDTQYAKEKITAIVIMGMGEPLLNLQSVIEFCVWVNAKYMYPFDKITISTSGLLPQMRTLLELPQKMHLALSLHSPFDSVRAQLIPTSKSVDKLIEFCHEYNLQRKRGIMIEYLMIENLTDRTEDIEKIIAFNLEKNTLFNLIPLNTTMILNTKKYSSSNPEKIDQFKKRLMAAGYKCFVREHKGEDISAACGMLK